ncbi:type I secretion outer membrane protein [Blastochloris viridis]|uniref:Type I secretion outer membrane protein n=1 Tax=Blastochloris viridis TaxID=1079 RepID=A0A182D292_BLAVI|nr:type I secretion outer membrane protein [Blastochloris viridis]
MALAWVCMTDIAWPQNRVSIHDAIRQTIRTNPGVGEATANRRATEAQWHQQQGTLLPQVRLEVGFGDERRDIGLEKAFPGNDQWRFGHYSSIVVRQLLFDGFASVNQLWRQAARVDAAAYRVREKTETLALDAAEAYIDVTRFSRLIGLAEEHLLALRRISRDVDARVSGGRSGEGDRQQAIERVAAAEATLAEFRLQLDLARARFKKVVGNTPSNLYFPGRLRGLPPTKQVALETALVDNATIRAATADARAARYDFDASKGNLVPKVALEGRVTRGEDIDFIWGSRDDAAGKVVMSWDIFTGGIDTWRRTELGERWAESLNREASLQRGAVESIDRAWAARTLTSDRMRALSAEIAAGRRVLVAYRSEFELGQRTLIDLLDAQNQLFIAQVSLVSTSGVAVFADYQLLAATGKILSYVTSAVPVEMAPLDNAFALTTPILQPTWFEPRTLPPDLTVGLVPPDWIEEVSRGQDPAVLYDTVVTRLGYASDAGRQSATVAVAPFAFPATTGKEVSAASPVTAMWGESTAGAGLPSVILSMPGRSAPMCGTGTCVSSVR